MKFNLESFIHLFIYLIHEKKDLICGNESFKNITNNNNIAIPWPRNRNKKGATLVYWHVEVVQGHASEDGCLHVNPPRPSGFKIGLGWALGVQNWVGMTNKVV